MGTLIIIIIVAIIIKEAFQKQKADNYANYAILWKEENVPKRDGESYMEWAYRADKQFEIHEKIKR